jgi:hypothetical protein
MSRMVLICFLAALLAACEIQGPGESALARERLACADVGLDPDGQGFDQCVDDLDQSLSHYQGG